jgi:hypothetical protein
MKAKYYPNGSFLEAQLGNQPSFAWRSIWGSGDLLKEGLMWHIGNGNREKIWMDKWVPLKHTFMIQSRPNGIEQEATFSTLIERDTH